jgi:ketosteroid isomerase-like protein
MTNPGDIAAAYFESWETEDFDRLRAILADDATFAGPMGTAANAEECVQGVQRLAQITERIEVRQRWVDGPDVLTWFELHTNVVDEPLLVANWSHVEGGKITRIRVTFDPRPLG